ncbi:MAG: hypothetical protein HYZ29_33960 [Myxococcales bacterium]|nr:hypothetical protein [Myxococcales bacterium]
MKTTILIQTLTALAVAGCTCGKNDDSTARATASTAPSAESAPVGAAAPGAPAQAAGASPAPVAAGGPSGTPGPAGGGKTIASNEVGKVQVNDAGAITAKRADGDSVTKGRDGTTKANGVVVDPSKGTVSVPGKGTFQTPPGATY